jgi:hypothetical protein
MNDKPKKKVNNHALNMEIYRNILKIMLHYNKV